MNKTELFLKNLDEAFEKVEKVKANPVVKKVLITSKEGKETVVDTLREAAYLLNCHPTTIKKKIDKGGFNKIATVDNKEFKIEYLK